MGYDPHAAAQVLLRLYELRREPELRQAREWFSTQFFPASADDVLKAWTGPNSAKYRMVTTYWEMAAAVVNHGAVPEAMFHDANTEHVAVWVKIEPFLDEVRTKAKYPTYLSQLERLVTRIPDLDAVSAPMRTYLAMRKAQLAGGNPPATPDPDE
jgi:hypothetical protein